MPNGAWCVLSASLPLARLVRARPFRPSRQENQALVKALAPATRPARDDLITCVFRALYTGFGLPAAAPVPCQSTLLSSGLTCGEESWMSRRPAPDVLFAEFFRDVGVARVNEGCSRRSPADIAVRPACCIAALTPPG